MPGPAAVSVLATLKIMRNDGFTRVERAQNQFVASEPRSERRPGLSHAASRRRADPKDALNCDARILHAGGLVTEADTKSLLSQLSPRTAALRPQVGACVSCHSEAAF